MDVIICQMQKKHYPRFYGAQTIHEIDFSKLKTVGDILKD